MKREELDRLVARDLDHITRGAKGSPQATLRMVYNAHRRSDLAKDPTASASRTLGRSIGAVVKRDGDFRPEFDSRYFGEGLPT